MKKRKFKDTVIGIMLLFFLVHNLSIFGYGLVYTLGLPLEFLGKDFMHIYENYFCTLGPLLIYIMIMSCFKEDRYMLKKFSFKNNKLLLGLAIGFIINSICVLVACLTNSLKLEYNYLNIPILLFTIIAVFIQCSEEEVLCRIYLYQKIKNSYNAKFALVANSIIFGLLHIFNDGMTPLAMISIIGFGILMSIFVFCFDDIWGAIGIHTSWNFTQNIIYGMPNSGMLPTYSIFKVTQSTNSLTYNTDFGIEGTVFTIIIVIITTTLLYLYGKKKTSQKEEIEVLE